MISHRDNDNEIRVSCMRSKSILSNFKNKLTISLQLSINSLCSDHHKASVLQ